MATPAPLPQDLPGRPRRAIVTGADSGIGRATAVTLAGGGVDVGITYHRDADGAEQTAREASEQGVSAVVEPMDLTDLPTAASAIDALADKLGGLDMLVNNAGTITSERALDTDFDRWRQVLGVDLDGSFLCAQRAARHMIENGNGGRIINITSVHEHQPRVGFAAYCAAKAGLGALTKVLALELAEHGITVNSIAPGEISTPMTGQDDVDPREQRRPGVPLGRTGDAHEVAAAVSFLATPAASYITGTSLPVDGGVTLMGVEAGLRLGGDDWRTA
ncbi:SDR family oxidoreductase [Haloechinothrix halophila]|uniref:SDR family oxidoreductase n=1 Tax=Haloechinothrix halophila TaxID=1069073 RepID=UPI00040C6F49|nr:SDR family oxidoreductase [Haloechinothrix halophila]